MKPSAAMGTRTQRFALSILVGLCLVVGEASAGKLTHRTLNVLEAVGELHITHPSLVEHYKSNPFQKLKLGSRPFSEGEPSTISSMMGDGGGHIYYAKLFLGTRPSGTFQLAELFEQLENELRPRIKVELSASYLDKHYPLLDVDKLDRTINEALIGKGKFITMPEKWVLKK